MQALAIYLDLIWQSVKGFFANYYNFYQMFVFLGVLALCFVMSKIFLKTFRKTKIARKHEKFVDSFNLVLFPLLTISILTIIYLINEKFFDHSYILFYCLKFCFLWAIVRFTKIFPKKNLLFTFISVSIISLTLLSILEIGQAKLTFQLGGFSISIHEFFRTVGITCFLIWLFSQVNTRIEGFIQKQWDLPPNSKELLVKVSNIGIIVFFALIGLNILGLDLTKFAFLTGAIGIGIGFGLKNIISNLVSGLILLLDKTIQKGSIVELDDISGTISNIGVRNTIVRSFDGKEILIPNEKFISDKVTNWTLSNMQIRLKVKIGVSYESDPVEVKEILQETLNNNRFVAKSPEARAYLDHFGDSSIDFVVFFWVRDVSMEYHQPKESVLMDIWQALKEHNINIPFPQLVIHQSKTDAK